MDKQLREKLRKGLPSNPYFELPEALGDPEKVPRAEVEQFLQATWDEFRPMSPKELHEMARSLKELSTSYRSKLAIEKEKVWAARRKQTHPKTGYVYIKLEGKIGQEGLHVGYRLIEHKRLKAGRRWETIITYFKPLNDFLKDAKELSKKYENASSLAESRLSVLREVERLRLWLGGVPTWKEYWGSLPQKVKRKVLGRRPQEINEYRRAIRTILASDEACAQYRTDGNMRQRIKPAFWQDVVRRAKNYDKDQDVGGEAESAYATVRKYMVEAGFSAPYTIDKIREWANMQIDE